MELQFYCHQTVPVPGSRDGCWIRKLDRRCHYGARSGCRHHGDVSWTYSGVIAWLSGYLVQVRVQRSAGWTNGSVVSPHAITMVTVASLVPFTWYDVQVVALQNGGTSVGSKVFAVMTPTATPWEAPSVLVATPISSLETMLTWVGGKRNFKSTTHTFPCIAMCGHWCASNSFLVSYFLLRGVVTFDIHFHS